MNNKFSLAGKRIWITGHKGMLGSSLLNHLEKKTKNILIATKSELDLRNYLEVDKWIKKKKPEIIFHTAAKVGGIYANKNSPTDFLFDNLKIQTNIIENAWKNKANKYR